MTSPSFYCFPDISRKEGRAPNPAPRHQPVFKRVTPGPRPDGARLQPFGGISNGRTGTAPPVPPEELEQAAFCRGFSDGEKKGYEQGERDGRETALKELEPVLLNLRQVVAELESFHRRESRKLEKRLVELALAVARTVVGQEVTVRPDIVTHLLQEAIGRIEHAGAITIRMNPTDWQRLSEAPSQVLTGWAEPGRVRFEPDAGISVGGCFIESEAGDVDARVEQRFRVVEEAFRAAARSDAETPGMPQ